MSRRVIVAIAGLVLVLGPGAVYAFTVLSAPLTAGFGWTPAQTQWAFALYSLFIAVGAYLGGRMSDARGPKNPATIGSILFAGGYALCGTLNSMPPNVPTLLLLYFYFGVLGGIGSGICYITALNSILRWTKSRRGLVSGFVIMGFGLGSLVYGSVIRSLDPFKSIGVGTKTYTDAMASALASGREFDPSKFMLGADDLATLMHVFLYSGLIFLIVSASASRLLSFPPEAEGTAKAGDFTTTEMFADARFYVLWAMLFLNVFGGSMIISAASPIISELTSLPLAEAAGIYSMLAIFNGLGRIAFGFLSDYIGRRYTFVAIFAMQALAFVLLDSAHDVVSVSIALSLLLFSYGGGFGTMPATNADFFGTKNFGANYGAMLSAWGLAAVAGAYFISIMKSFSGSYVGMMQPISVIVLVALFFPMIIENPGTEKKREAAPPVDSAAAAVTA